MTATTIDGRKEAAKIKRKLKNRINTLKEKHHIVPGLSVVRVGDNPASQIYVSSKCRQCEEVGILSKEYYLPEETNREDLIELIHRLNADNKVHGILLQLPLPEHLDADEIISIIDPKKDVDGLHPLNAGLLMTTGGGTPPCTPKGCMHLIKTIHKKLDGLHAVIVGRSQLVGKPMALMMLQENCTVTMAHSRTKNIKDICRQADILIVAVGYPKLVKKEWIKFGATIIDVGINRLVNADGTSDICGDVDYEDVLETAGAMTPVPGGVGVMTVSSLLVNTIDLAAKHAEK